jgi:lipopolysaccharide biosynthesis glycosyltransferase
MSEPPHIVVCINERFAPGAWMVFWTIWRNWDRETKPVFHVLTTDRGTPGIRRLESLAARAGMTLRLHDAEMTAVEGLPTGQYTSYTYVRLLAPLVLRDLPKYLYFDADVFVRASLAPLFETDFSEAAAAVQEYGINSLGAGVPYAGLSDEERQRRYFNAGALLVNVPVWNAANLSPRMLEFLHTHKASLKHADQDGVNGVLKGAIHELDAKWNFQSDAMDYLDSVGWPENRRALETRRGELMESAAMVHFLGPHKPWLRWLTTPYAGEYRALYLRSGWLTWPQRQRLRLVWLAESARLTARRLKHDFLRRRR